MIRQTCGVCGAPITEKKCTYCNTKVKLKKDMAVTGDNQAILTDGTNTNPSNESGATSKRKISSFLGLFIMVAFVVVMILSQLNQNESEDLRYICDHKPTDSGVETTTIIESRGFSITRWINRHHFPRQVYIDYMWGPGWDLSDDDIISWYEGPENVTEMDGTYWELIAVNEDYVTVQFVYHYEVMSREDLDLLWDPNFSGVTHYSAIRSLTDEGAVCEAE